MKRPATALAASAALLVGAFLPLAFSNDAQAAPNCSAQKTAYTNSVKHVAKAKKKAQRARKHVAKAVAHRASPKIIRAKRDTLHVKRVDLRFAKMSRNHYYAALLSCEKSGTTTPQGTAKPVPTGTAKPTATSSASATAKPSTSASASATATSTTTTTTTTNPLDQLLAALSGSGLSASALTDALNQIADQIKASGAPGAAQLADALDQVAAAIASGASSIDPAQLQAILSQLPSSMDPAAFQKALTDAAAQIQAELQAAMANPTSMTAAGLIDDILNPLISGLTTAGVPGLPSALSGVQDTLDSLLSGLGLGALAGALPSAPSLPGASSIPIVGGIL